MFTLGKGRKGQRLMCKVTTYLFTKFLESFLQSFIKLLGPFDFVSSINEFLVPRKSC